MVTLADQSTDPAREIAEVIDWMRAIPPGEQQIWHTLHQALAIQGGHAEFLEILAALAVRLAELAELTNSIVDSDLENDQRAMVTAAITRLSNVIAPAHMQTLWKNALSNWVLETDATLLRMYGATIRQHRPLRRVADEERQELLSQIEAAIAEVQSDAALAGWGREALVVGLRRLHLVMRHFRFFGHEAAARELVLVTTAAESVEKRTGGKKGASLLAVFGVVTALYHAIEIIKAPDDFRIAFGDYAQLLLGGSEPAQLQLPAPALVDNLDGLDDSLGTTEDHPASGD